ncbi:phosphonate metabolism protein PhnP [Marinobacterium aestuariivivens]|uniref:Phosphonate metabolism protein PhnP n=1 Tax=Marinobacterium aestuariivivens TaxID=1698799 RepID=A0ABW1ZVM6_9GAMM
MVELELLGTGDAGRVPLWGCECPACDRARLDERYRRRPCSAALHARDGITLIDAGSTDLAERFTFDEIRRIWLTHFHMDHVQGLFHLRWSERIERIPVYRPEDDKGADDLYKHPGVLSFQPPCRPFESRRFGAISVTPLPLNHSRPTQGLLIETAHTRLAWLTDTVGLPDETRDFLLGQPPLHWLVLDCSVPPQEIPPRNHNDLNQALTIHNILAPKRTLLTHVGQRLDTWLMEHPGELPEDVTIATDGMRIGL